MRVRDEGIGLDGSELAQLFNRGYRAESVRTVRGAGLGLYFGHGIVRAHGGQMSVESQGHGEGSTFWVSLPRTESEPAPLIIEPAPKPVPSLSPSRPTPTECAIYRESVARGPRGPRDI